MARAEQPGTAHTVTTVMDSRLAPTRQGVLFARLVDDVFSQVGMSSWKHTQASAEGVRWWVEETDSRKVGTYPGPIYDGSTDWDAAWPRRRPNSVELPAGSRLSPMASQPMVTMSPARVYFFPMWEAKEVDAALTLPTCPPELKSCEP